jgi:hypothetical protein
MKGSTTSIYRLPARIHTSATITPDQNRIGHKRKVLHSEDVLQSVSPAKKAMDQPSPQPSCAADLARQNGEDTVACDSVVLDDVFADPEDTRNAKRPKTKAKKVII